jgi:CheY-like chemotaxis protein
MTNNGFRPSILIADDYADDIDHIERYLPKAYAPVRASDVRQARAILDKQHMVLAIIDLYFDDKNMVPHGIRLLEDYRHVPILIMSGQDGAMIDRALDGFKDRFLKVVSKDKDLKDRAAIEREIDAHMRRHYNVDIAMQFRKGGSWEGIALSLNKSHESAIDLPARAHEIEMLVRNAFCDWDQSKSKFVRASQLWIEEQIHEGDSSVVLRLSLQAADSAPQAEVVLKITRRSDEHSKFGAFKNVLGGYGLRERRYARTVNYHAQVYSVPYYRYEQTSTYRDFFMRSSGEAVSLQRIEAVTKHLFHEALGNFADRPLTERQRGTLRDYYLQRINAPKRIAAITQDLTPAKAPAAIAMTDNASHIAIGFANTKISLRNPTQPALVSGNYAQSSMLIDRSLRHGDMHGSNVLVDSERRSTWYIDYEHFAVDHYCLADHVEMEAHILYNAMRISRNFAFWAAFSDALFTPSALTGLQNLSAQAEDPTDRAEAAKAFSAINMIRLTAQHCNPAGTPLPYYHALLFEALRAAGARSKEDIRRWYALVTAAQLFERLES